MEIWERTEVKMKVNDYIDVCYVLNINIEWIKHSIWIWAEYIWIFDHIAKVHNNLICQSARHCE